MSEMLEDAAELVMEGVDHGTEHWDKLKLGTAKLTGLGSSSRRDDDRRSRSKSNRRDKDRDRDRRKDSSRRKSFNDTNNDDRYFGYDNDRDDYPYYDRARNYSYNSYDDSLPYYSSSSQQRPQRPRNPRRTSSLDRREQDERLDRYHHPRAYRDSSPSDRNDFVSRSKRKLNSTFGGDDTKAVLATGAVAIGTVFAASKLFDAYQDRQKGGGGKGGGGGGLLGLGSGSSGSRKGTTSGGGGRRR